MDESSVKNRGRVLARLFDRPGRPRAEYALLDEHGRPATGERTRDLLEAYGWLRAAQLGGLARSLGARRVGTAGWRRRGPALQVPELVWEAAGGNAAALVLRGPAPVPVRLARRRAAALLVGTGIDGADAASLLPCYRGFFPSLEVAVARLLHARLGGRGLAWMRRLDLRALLDDLVTGAAIWTLDDEGNRRWPAGIHLFTARSQPQKRGTRGRTRGSARPGQVGLSHAAPS